MGKFVTGLFRYLGCGKQNRTSKKSPVAIALDSKQVVSFEELLMSQVIQQEALRGCLLKRDNYKEVLEMVRVVGNPE